MGMLIRHQTSEFRSYFLVIFFFREILQTVNESDLLSEESK